MWRSLRLVRQVVLLTLGLAAPLPAAAGEFDEARLKTIPLIEIIRIATPPYQDGHERSAAKLAPQARTLIRLAAIDANLFETDGAAFSGDPKFFPGLAAALDDARLSRQASAFRAAIPGGKPTFPFVPRDAGRLPDTMTLSLGTAFGTKAAFEDAILGYVASHPDAAAWCDAARRTISDSDRLYALEVMLAQIPLNASMQTLATWPEPYRKLQLASLFEGELSNGGVEQYFWNTHGALAPATVEALRAMALPRQAAVIERGIGLFAPPYPTDTDARRRVLRDGPHGRDIDNKLAALTADADVDGIDPAIVAYARSQGLLPR